MPRTRKAVSEDLMCSPTFERRANNLADAMTANTVQAGISSIDANTNRSPAPRSPRKGGHQMMVSQITARQRHVRIWVFARRDVCVSFEGAETIWRRLTVKLRGRQETPDWSRGCTMSSRTRGDTTDCHGSLQRLLGGSTATVPRPRHRCHEQDHGSQRHGKLNPIQRDLH
jgi:hypothetical protein